MAKGSPDSQHELIATGIRCCLEAAYPKADLSFGTKVPDLNLKPDIFVDHLNGQRWAYEVFNKNRPVRQIEATHRKHLQSRVQAYWVVWQTLGPEKSPDDTSISQSVWISDEIMDAPRRYQLNELQRTLAQLGEGRLYVFSIHKPFLDLVERWALKLVMAGLDIYRFSTDRLAAEWIEGNWDFVPLPCLTFDERGRPHCKTGVDKIPPFLQPFMKSFSGGPVFASEAWARLEALIHAADFLLVSMRQALTQLGEQYGHEKLPQTEELARAFDHFQKLVSELSQNRAARKADLLQVMDALDKLIAALPVHLQSAFREIMPMTGDMLRWILELKRWFEEDEHLQELLAKM